MRIDKFLKVSRIIKRRTIANEAADNGRISVNGRVVKPSYDIKINDIVEIKFGDQTSKFKITAIPTKQSVRTDEVAEMID
jgi:S4 RNA-binding domain protein